MLEIRIYSTNIEERKMPRPYKPSEPKGCISMDNLYVVFTYDRENFKRESSDDGYDTFTIKVKRESIVKDSVDEDECADSSSVYMPVGTKLSNRYSAVGKITGPEVFLRAIQEADSSKMLRALKDMHPNTTKERPSFKGGLIPIPPSCLDDISELLDAVEAARSRADDQILDTGLGDDINSVLSAVDPKDFAESLSTGFRQGKFDTISGQCGTPLGLELEDSENSLDPVGLPEHMDSANVIPYARFLAESNKQAPH